MSAATLGYGYQGAMLGNQTPQSQQYQRRSSSDTSLLEENPYLSMMVDGTLPGRTSVGDMTDYMSYNYMGEAGSSRKAQRIRRDCSVSGCRNRAKGRGLCKRHGGGSRCKHPGCSTSAKKDGLCIKHGGGLCKVPGCKSGARKNDMCHLHNRVYGTLNTTSSSTARAELMLGSPTAATTAAAMVEASRQYGQSMDLSTAQLIGQLNQSAAAALMAQQQVNNLIAKVSSPTGAGSPANILLPYNNAHLFSAAMNLHSYQRPQSLSNVHSSAPQTSANVSLTPSLMMTMAHSTNPNARDTQPSEDMQSRRSSENGEVRASRILGDFLQYLVDEDSCSPVGKSEHPGLMPKITIIPLANHEGGEDSSGATEDSSHQQRPSYVLDAFIENLSREVTNDDGGSSEVRREHDDDTSDLISPQDFIRPQHAMIISPLGKTSAAAEYSSGSLKETKPHLDTSGAMTHSTSSLLQMSHQLFPTMSAEDN